MFGLFAEVERDLISERTKDGLAAARAKGRMLGRPKGALGRSKLDGKEDEIRMLLKKAVGDRAGVLIRLEGSIDELLHEIKVAGGLPEFEATLRQARRILVRSHEE